VFDVTAQPLKPIVDNLLSAGDRAHRRVASASASLPARRPPIDAPTLAMHEAAQGWIARFVTPPLFAGRRANRTTAATCPIRPRRPPASYDETLSLHAPATLQQVTPAMTTHRLGLIMRRHEHMGMNQHLIRSIVAIRSEVASHFATVTRSCPTRADRPRCTEDRSARKGARHAR
jgi:hypothetical protein